MAEFLPSGIVTRVIHCEDGARLVDRLRLIPEATAIISVGIDPRAKVPWFPWWVRSCNEVCRYVSGVDYWFQLLNPHHFVQKKTVKVRSTAELNCFVALEAQGWGGNDDYSDQLQEQNRQTQAEIEQKKQSLFQTRLDMH